MSIGEAKKRQDRGEIEERQRAVRGRRIVEGRGEEEDCERQRRGRGEAEDCGRQR